MQLFKVVLILEYKYKKTYLVIADSPGEAKIIASEKYIKGKRGIINAPDILDIKLREYGLKKGVLDVQSRCL